MLHICASRSPSAAARQVPFSVPLPGQEQKARPHRLAHRQQALLHGTIPAIETKEMIGQGHSFAPKPWNAVHLLLAPSYHSCYCYTLSMPPPAEFPCLFPSRAACDVVTAAVRLASLAT